MVMLAEGIRNDAGYGACIVPLWFQKRLCRRFSRMVCGLAWMAWPPPHIRVEQDMQRKQADPFYLSKAWRTVRAEALRRDHGMCVRCMERFMNGGEKPRLAVMVHHKKSRKEYPELELDLDNLESLCDICHNREHPEKGKKKPETGLPDICKGIRIIDI